MVYDGHAFRRAARGHVSQYICILYSSARTEDGDADFNRATEVSHRF